MSGIPDAEFLQDAFIQEGVSPVPGVVIAACTVGDDEDAPKNRVGIRQDGEWLEFSLSDEAILSVDATPGGEAYVLGENGTVVRFDWKTPKTRDALRASRKLFTNGAVHDQGPLRRLRVLGGDVLCAGSVGQVYRLRDDNFEPLPPLTVDGQPVTIEDLAGNSREDFIAVASDGYAAHFNGSTWRILPLPIHTELTAICKLEQGYAICGKSGAVMTGSGDEWSDLTPFDGDRDYWGIAAHQGTLYVAHLAGIDHVSGQALRPLGLPKEAPLQFTVLRGASDGVWSFADHTIGRLHDGQWHTLTSGPRSP